MVARVKQDNDTAPSKAQEYLKNTVQTTLSVQTATGRPTGHEYGSSRLLTIHLQVLSVVCLALAEIAKLVICSTVIYYFTSARGYQKGQLETAT